MGACQQLWEVYKEAGDEDAVRRSVARKLGHDADAPAVGDFVRELEVMLADENVLLLMLSVGLGGVFESPASFLGLLLREEVLQPRLVDLLLEKLAEFAAALDAQLMDRNVPKLVLRELRWMDLVVDSQQVVEKLIAALPAFPPGLQQEVIYILPELASDEDAVIVVNALLELIRNESAMVVCCIEALGNFNVLTDQTSSVLHCILDRLESSPMSDLPVIVKYLVQEAPMLDVEQVVEQVRDKISTMVALTATSEGTAPRNGQEEEALILGSIVQGMHFRGDLMKAFLSQMQASSQWLLLDLWLVVGAHSIPQHRLKLEKLLVKKAKAGVVTPDLLAQSVMGHGDALKPYFSSILSLASTLIGQPTGPECRHLGSTLYQVLLEEFSGQRGSSNSSTQAAFYQGEIVSVILGHCLANGTDATTAGMDILMALVLPPTPRESSGCAQASRTSPRRLQLPSSLTQRRQRLQVFLPSLKQMLDTMELYSADQVRKMYDALFAIAGHDDSDLCNVLRKQGFHQHLRYRSFGIIGTISRLRRVLEHFRESDREQESSSAADTGQSRPLAGSRTSDAAAAKAFNAILVELHTSCKSSAQCISFMLDELTILVSTATLDKYTDVLMSIVFDYYMDILSTHFMEDYDWRRKPEGVYSKPVLGGVMKSELWLGLDEKRSPVYLKILDLVVSPNVVERESLLYLTSLVSLVMTCARKRNQVSEIECVLICPVQLMEKSVLSELSAIDDRAAQNAICCCLWYAVNWTRSLLNFFASESKEYYVAKVMQRLEDLSRLEATLFDETLGACPMFSVPGSAHATDLSTAGKGKLEVKKRGRPPKVANDAATRASTIKNSFLPLQPEVLNILVFPRLLHDVPAGSTNSSDDTQPPVETLPIKEEKLTRVGLLFSLLLSNLESCCKKKASSHWTTSKQLPESSSWKASHSLTKSGDMLLSDLVKAGVLNAAGAFAREFVARIIRYQENSPVVEEETKQSEEGDDSADETIKLMLKGILGDYLKIVAIVMNDGRVESSDDDNAGSGSKALVNHAEQLILAQGDRSGAVADSDDDLKMVVAKCFANVQEYQRVVEDDLSMAVALLKCLTSLLSLIYGFDSTQFVNRTAVIDLRGGDSDRTPQAAHSDPTTARMAEAINAMALSYLETDWSGGDAKYTHPTAQLEALLRCYIFYGPIVLNNIQALAIDGFLELLEQNGKRTTKLPTLDKKSVAIYHRVMFSALVAATSRLDVAASDTQFVFNYLGQAVLLFKLLVCLTKSFHKSLIIATVLKTGRKFIEMILQMMPFLETQFQEHMDRVIKIITDVQVATRRIQVLCAHGKLIKDQSTASQVPKVKKLLEKLIYRGEALASANGVLQYYSTGVLKNRRIDGTAITKEELEGSSESESESEHEEEAAGDQEDDTESEEEEQVKGETDAENENEGDEGEDAPVVDERPRKRR